MSGRVDFYRRMMDVRRQQETMPERKGVLDGEHTDRYINTTQSTSYTNRHNDIAL